MLLLRLLLLNIFSYSVVYYFSPRRPKYNETQLNPQGCSQEKGGGRRKWLWLSKWSQFPGEKTTNTKILCSIHLWWFQLSLQHPKTLSTINTSKYLFQILDTPTKRKLSFCNKDNRFSLRKNRHKLYLNLKINITNSIYRYPS